MPISTASVTSLSVIRLCRSAASSPAASPSSVPSSNAEPANSSVGPSLPSTASSTGCSSETERPRSPCQRLPSHSR